MDSEKEKNSCQICGKTFSTVSNRDIHMRIHTGEKPYSCEICGKSFTQLGNKDMHMRTHTREKPYPCEICYKSFPRIDSKINHMRTHSGEKPYSCNLCGKSFSQKGNRETHMKKHTTGTKLDKSDKCSMSFNYGNKHKYNYNGIQSTMKPVCVKLRKLSPLEIKSLSKINNEHSLDSISEEETLDKDPLTIQIDGTITTVVEETKEKDLEPINIIGEDINEENIIINKDEHVKNVEAPNILNVKEEIKDEKTLANDSFSINEENVITTKDEHANNDEAPIVMNGKEKIKKEETLANDSLFIKEEPAFIDKTNPKLKEDNAKLENIEIEVEEEDLVKKYWEEFTSDLPKTKEEETLANDSLSIKEEPAFVDKANADVNVKEEETGDYLYDSDTIDKIDIEEFKLEETDV